jgi:hypothetical protein
VFVLCDAQNRLLGKFMTSEITGFLIAVGAVSAVCFVLMTRVENKRLNRARSGGSPAYDGSSSGGDSWSFAGLGGSSSSSEASGHTTDSGACVSGGGDGGGDSGGGGNCGGGGDSGGGGDGGGGGGSD